VIALEPGETITV